jgi:NFU1 iron-sulfur cluster scaffold homolog, mitochondrial
VSPVKEGRPSGSSWPEGRSGDRNCFVIRLDPTPNPNAVKFTVGTPVGGPATFVAGQPTDNAMASAILQLEGVTSIFMTADFVTISKSPEGDWGGIVPEAQAILEEHYG